MAAAPVLLSQTRPASDTAGSELLCGCKDAPGAECPMHKGKRQAPAKGSGHSRLGAACGDEAAAILTLLTSSGGALLQQSSAAIRPAQTGVALAMLITLIPNVDRPPTSPPPRS